MKVLALAHVDNARFDHNRDRDGEPVAGKNFFEHIEISWIMVGVGRSFHVELDAPRGASYLRSGVCDLASGKAGTMEMGLTAPGASQDAQSH